MYNLIVYGSLLHVEELKKHNIDLDRIDFVKVKGFKRVFNQLPSWRKVEGNKKAVLNIEADENAWFNAIVIQNLDQEYIDDLDHRERGYDRVHLPDGDVKNYEGKIIKNCIVYKGKKGKQSSEILPIPEYFEICKSGAKSHFDEFYKDYLNTTYQNSLDGKIELI
ncbi:gamma-glutamylcyclotransferase family protein [Sulfurospirillum sp. 1307]|jgi:hypothetical protein